LVGRQIADQLASQQERVAAAAQHFVDQRLDGTTRLIDHGFFVDAIWGR
jgi:hypothetical protein